MTHLETVKGVELNGKVSGLVTYRDFQKLMLKRHRTVDDLVELLRGKIEDPRDYFERVMECKRRDPETRRYVDTGGVVIPYKSVLKFYHEEKHYQEDLDSGK